MAIRQKDDWEGWLKFFLKGISFVSDEATNSATEIIEMRERHLALLRDRDSSNLNCSKLLDLLYERPIVTINLVKDTLQVSHPTASSLVSSFCDIGLLKLRGDVKRNRKYAYIEYLDILSRGTEV
jgi:Fic family protein